MCAATRANFWLRTVRPEDSQVFTERHDAHVWECFRAILGLPAAPVSAKVIAHLPVSLGGLGLTNAVQTKDAPPLASWADSICMVRKRHPIIAYAMIAGIDRDPAPSMFSGSEKVRTGAGGCRFGKPTVDADPEPNGPKFGRQQKAPRQLQERSSAEKWCGFPSQIVNGH